ncbi:MAG: hypothetical protein DWQ02_05040 [Bacteroidetes bacterium]|nr:MAG: hypothetical protein DWQ02_05040 [Bacteroidota bacterium]
MCKGRKERYEQSSVHSLQYQLAVSNQGFAFEKAFEPGKATPCRSEEYLFDIFLPQSLSRTKGREKAQSSLRSI